MEAPHEFSFNRFWGPDGLRSHVEFSRKGLHYCIYCGSIADTREHVPSRAFLKRPLPSDLPVLPACKKCNNGFSSDELYTRTYIECLKEILLSGNTDSIEEQQDDRKEVLEAKETIKNYLNDGIITYDNRVGRILLKLAIGHAVYELSEGYYSREWNGIPYYTRYIIRKTVSEEEWNDLEYAEYMNDKLLPEMGSRAYRNIYVVQPFLTDIRTGEQSTSGLLMMDWTDIQDGEYRYIAYFEGDNLVVKMILMDFLYAEVVFQKDDREG